MDTIPRGTPTGSIGFLSLLGLAFIVLKLCGVIDWSWWLVTLPIWGPAAVVFGTMASVFVGAIIAGLALGLFALVMALIERKR